MMFALTAAAILAAMAITLVRALSGPTVFDRILSVNAFGSMTVVLIAVYGFLSGRPDFLDIALVYVLINFIATIALTKFVKFSHLGQPEDEYRQGDI